MGIKSYVFLMAKFMVSASQTCNMGPQRLGSIQGLNDKSNDVIYHPPKGKSSSILIYFGGDMQDYPENMLAHRDNKNYVKWNLENTAILLHDKFPASDIFIVRPYWMHLKTFSCYRNFVNTNDFGVPSHEISVDALKHLNLLIQNAQEKLCLTRTDSESMVNGPVKEKPISLIGFSKGCVVLNQLLYSFMDVTKESSSDLYVQEFVKRINVMYWLDGGHNGSDNTWITNKSILENFCKLGIKTRIHVTPYQMMCPTRPRLGKEEKQFRDTLKKLGNDIERTLYFEDQVQSPETHFQVLVEFQSSN